MAVFTDITSSQYQAQLSEIEAAFSMTITSIAGIPQGSSDTLFRITAREYQIPLVLTIHETPDVSPAGLTNEAAQKMILYMEFLAGKTSEIKDSYGEAVKLAVPEPFPAQRGGRGSDPFVEISFDNVIKTVSLMPYFEGRSFQNTPDEHITADEAFLAGRGLAGYLTIAQSYDRPELFREYDFELYVDKIQKMLQQTWTLERLGYVLSGQKLKEEEAEKLGRKYLSEMYESGRKLIDAWRVVEAEGSIYPRTLIHGDMYTDNVLITDDERLVLLDFSDVHFGPIGIDIGVTMSSWASKNGKPLTENIVAFLDGFDQVMPLKPAALSKIPILTCIGAFRWETFRIGRMSLQDPRRRAMRSPEELKTLRQAWGDLEDTFQGLDSISELASRLGVPHLRNER